MKKKDIGMDFRAILKSKPKGLLPHLCSSKASPTCLYNFIKSREEQTQCYNCLVHNDLLEDHPLLQCINPEDK